MDAYSNIDKLEPEGRLMPGKWSSLSESERLTIGKIFLLNNAPVFSKLKEAGNILQIYKLNYLTRKLVMQQE